jgi:hypothetical protein
MIYGVYSNDALVHWAPSKIFGDEIKVSLPAIHFPPYHNKDLRNRRSLAHLRKHIVSRALLHIWIAGEFA